MISNFSKNYMFIFGLKTHRILYYWKLSHFYILLGYNKLNTVKYMTFKNHKNNKLFIWFFEHVLRFNDFKSLQKIHDNFWHEKRAFKFMISEIYCCYIFLLKLWNPWNFIISKNHQNYIFLYNQTYIC